MFQLCGKHIVESLLLTMCLGATALHFTLHRKKDQESGVNGINKLSGESTDLNHCAVNEILLHQYRQNRMFNTDVRIFLKHLLSHNATYAISLERMPTLSKCLLTSLLCPRRLKLTLCGVARSLRQWLEVNVTPTTPLPFPVASQPSS